MTILSKRTIRALRKNIAAAKADPQRPRYHFAPPANWMNDPNGTIYHNGEYHLFYQFNPAKPKWGNLHWGHAKSKDLVQWEHLPIALFPDGIPGELHCWSGCLVIDDHGVPTIIYTSMNLRSLGLTRARRYAQQWAARGSPDMVTWEKHPANPILVEDIHGEKIPEHWRDPYVWKDEDGGRWLMVLCGNIRDEKPGSIFLYESQNLIDWEYIGVLSQGSLAEGKGWECPNYFKLGDKYILVVSPYGPVIYSVGNFDGRRHIAETWYTLDHGKDFYATNTYLGARGSIIIVGWVKAEGDGWKGCLSLPRILRLDDKNQLFIRPLPELKTLRRSLQHFERELESVTEAAGTAPLFGQQLEIKAVYELEQAESFGFSFSDDEGEHKLIFDFQSHVLEMGDQKAHLQFSRSAKQIELHIFIDHSVIEIFINGREVFTTSFYPKLAEFHALKISPFIRMGKGRFWMDVWKLEEASISGTQIFR